MTPPPDVARLQSLGFEPFPCKPDKSPRVPKGRDWRSAPAGDWTWREDDLMGVPMPADTIAIDVDDRAAFEASGLTLPPTEAIQGSRREGGGHAFYRTDGRPAPQVTDKARGYDTRVAGLGYVIAWQPERWIPAADWAPAPEWVYEAPERPKATGSVADTMGTRDDILRWLGTMAAHVRITESEYLALLKAARDGGRVVALDPARPWTDGILAKLASEAAEWEPEDPARTARFLKALGIKLATAIEDALTDVLAGMDATELLTMDLPKLRQAFPGLLPEGFGLLVSPPKAGKSLLAYQLGIELQLGGMVLGRTAEKRPVLYYALEDGRRRSQSRIKAILGGRKLPAGLELRWLAPFLGGPLETEVSGWLDGHPDGVVIIDVLSKVRPPGKAKQGNAYDEDYAMLTGLHAVARRHPGSIILMVTHDRKAGSEDWMTRVTGTRGVTGVADFVLFVDRKRNQPAATIFTSGRDLPEEAIAAMFMGDHWEPADFGLLIGAASPTRQAIFAYVKDHGPIYQKAIAEGTGLSETVVYNRVADMAKDGTLVSVPGGYVVPEAD
jgi:hypothetical protein